MATNSTTLSTKFSYMAREDQGDVESSSPLEHLQTLIPKNQMLRHVTERFKRDSPMKRKIDTFVVVFKREGAK